MVFNPFFLAKKNLLAPAQLLSLRKPSNLVMATAVPCLGPPNPFPIFFTPQCLPSQSTLLLLFLYPTPTWPTAPQPAPFTCTASVNLGPRLPIHSHCCFPIPAPVFSHSPGASFASPCNIAMLSMSDFSKGATGAHQEEMCKQLSTTKHSQTTIASGGCRFGWCGAAVESVVNDVRPVDSRPAGLPPHLDHSALPVTG